MKIHDSVLGLLFVLIGGAFLFVVSGYPKMPGQDVGPSMFPGITAALLAMFGLILFVRGLINASQGQALIALGDWTASPRHIAAVGCWHHDVIVPVGHKNGNVDASQILRCLTAPGLDGAKLAQECAWCRLLVAIDLALFEACQKVLRCPAAIG